MAVTGRGIPNRPIVARSPQPAASGASASAALAGIGSVTATQNFGGSATAAATVTVAVTVVGSVGKSATATATVTGVAAAATNRFIAGVSANGRYMVDQSGSPILVRGASYWPAVALVPPSDIGTLYAALAAAGHNACILDAVGGVGVNVAASGQTYDGVAPFVSGDITQFNSAYWSRVDSHVAAARANGITLWFLPIDHYAVADSGVFSGKSAADCTTYGTNLANRYASYPNIVWFFGNDYTPTTGEDDQAGGALAGIRSTGDTRPATIMINAPGLSTDTTYWESRSQTNTVYTVYAQYQKVAAGYNRTPGARDPRPAIFTEGRYELDSWYTISGEPSPNTPIIRQQELWSLTAGSPGGFYGNNDWRFASGWQSRLGTYAAEQQLKKLRTLIAGLPWWKLQPDAGGFITAGRGTQITDDSAVYPWQNDYVTAAYAADGSLAAVYVPTNVGNTNARTITMDLTRVGSSNRTALWIDPTDATSTQTATINGSSQTTTPAAHSDGTRDWLLLIQADPIGGTATATITGAATVAGVLGKVTSATASGTGSVTTGATATSAVTVTATGTAAAVGSTILTGTASLVGTGSVAATGTNGTVATPTATGTVAAVGVVGMSATSILTGAGATGPTGSAAATASPTVTGVVNATGGIAGGITASINATCAVTASGVVGVAASATLTGTGVFTADGSAGKAATANIGGVGSVIAAGTNGVVVATTCTGTLTASGVVTSGLSASIVTTGAIIAVGVVGRSASATAVITGAVDASRQPPDLAITVGRPILGNPSRQCGRSVW